MKIFRILVLQCILIGTTGYCLTAGSSSAPSFEELRRKRSPQTDLNLVEAINKLDVKAIENALKEGANPNWNSGRQRPTPETRYNCSAIELAVTRVCKPAFFRTRPFISSTMKEYYKEHEELCIKIMKLLFEAGAKLQESDDDILYYPIWCGCSSVVQYLLEKGANPSARMLHDITPVEFAEQYGHGDILNMLLKHGGKPITLKEAAQLRFVRFAEENDIIGMEKALKDGAVLDETNKAGETALISAVIASHYNIERYATILFLLQKGANPNRRGLRILKQTPLHIIVSVPFKHQHDRSNNESSEDVDRYFEYTEKAHQVYLKLTVEAILEAGAFVSARDVSGQTPLHIAAMRNNLVVAAMLIKAGAKLMDRDKDGKTPLDYAESADMIKLLKSHGAKEE